MKEAFWQIIEKFPVIGIFLNFVILVVLPAIVIFGLVRSIKRKNKITIIIFSCLNFCYLLFFIYLFFSFYYIFKLRDISYQELHNEMEQTHYYSIKEINPKFDLNTIENDFPIIKINEGVSIGGDNEKSFKFYNKPDYRITGFVFYFGISEVSVKSEFVPGTFYEINFEKMKKEYPINDVGVFYYVKEDPEHHEIWTGEMEDGINCLFIK